MGADSQFPRPTMQCPCGKTEEFCDDGLCYTWPRRFVLAISKMRNFLQPKRDSENQNEEVSNMEDVFGQYQGQLSQMSGATLQRSFILQVQEWRLLMKKVKSANVADGTKPNYMSDEDVAKLCHELLVREGNMQQSANQICVELGLPVV